MSFTRDELQALAGLDPEERKNDRAKAIEAQLQALKAQTPPATDEQRREAYKRADAALDEALRKSLAPVVGAEGGAGPVQVPSPAAHARPEPGVEAAAFTPGRASICTGPCDPGDCPDCDKRDAEERLHDDLPQLGDARWGTP